MLRLSLSFVSLHKPSDGFEPTRPAGLTADWAARCWMRDRSLVAVVRDEPQLNARPALFGWDIQRHGPDALGPPRLAAQGQEHDPFDAAG